MQSLTEINKKKKLHMERKRHLKLIKVRKASVEDIDGIMNVAMSVGKGKSESYHGFLMDNYKKNKNYFRKLFLEKIRKLKFFYVAEKNGKILGFLIGCSKEEWLLENPNWIKDVSWNPEFDMKKTKHFVLSDKLAILASQTGRGIGSKIYKRFLKDSYESGYKHLFSETIIDPVPNFASLSFRKKQSYELSGIRYENYQGNVYTDLIYYKPIEKRKKNELMLLDK